MRGRRWVKIWRHRTRLRFGKVMKCISSEEQLASDGMVPSSDSLATKDYTASGCSSRTTEGEKKRDMGNIEEAESSLRESDCLNYEEARALLGRLEYQRGNIEAALHVFDGIDIASVLPKMKVTLARRVERRKRRSSDVDGAPMSIHAASLLFEAVLLKAKSLQHLGRFKEAAHSCKIILDTVESSLLEGLPENFSSDYKLQETLAKAIELLPELWKCAGFLHEAVLSYRRALLYSWNLDSQTTAKIQKEFAILLLYGGCDASSPNLRSQMDGSFVPKNNIEEAVLLLLILLKKFMLKRVEWDPSVLDHLTFALSLSGEMVGLAKQVEGLLPGVLERKEGFYTLALSYFGANEDLIALNLLKKVLSRRESPNCVEALLLASKICIEKSGYTEEGLCFAQRALDCLHDGCNQMKSMANCLLGIFLSADAKVSLSESERATKQSEAIKMLEMAESLMIEKDPNILYHLCLEKAEQRKLDVALDYATEVLKSEGGSSIRSWILLARILSAQKRYVDAETLINAALDQTGKWNQAELLRTNARLQMAQGRLKDAVETYSHLLAILQVLNKSFGSSKKLSKIHGYDRKLEAECWEDLASVYTSLSQWHDAQICLQKSQTILRHSASRWHATGILYAARGLLKEAQISFENALQEEPTHIASLVSLASMLKRQGKHMLPARSFLMDALRMDKMNHAAWFNLGLLYKSEGGLKLAAEAAECFEAAAFLEESAPVEPFR